MDNEDLKTALKTHLKNLAAAIDNRPSYIEGGFVVRVKGMLIEAIGLSVPMNTLCELVISDSKRILAEVIGFANEITYLMAFEDVSGLSQESKVYSVTPYREVFVGDALLGRVLSGMGEPIDKKKSLDLYDTYPLFPSTINPLERAKITTPLDVGVKAINGMLTVGRGQRIGIFAGSGVGKSVLLGMMTRFSEADVIVIGLIGERGREVKEFIEDNLGEEGLKRSIIIASPADTTPLMRVNAAAYANTIAEYFRNKGCHVLLIVDSLTRYAQALREIYLAVGELPATKGFSPSVFRKVSQLIERSGNGINGVGSITAFYTVLVEGDDLNDPIADHARSILDGHICLSRELAESGHYPAIDVEKSISRVMVSIVSKEHLEAVSHIRQLLSSYKENQALIQVGMYQPGTNSILDEAVQRKDKISGYLTQSLTEKTDFAHSVQGLFDVLAH